MIRYLPAAFAVLLIVGLTFVQVQMTDRFSDSTVTAKQRAELLKDVPKNIGDWHGVDMPLNETVRETAGAVGAIQRKYRNIRTNEEVDLWLIVGHGRALSRHTPDRCYKNAGFTPRSVENSVYPMEIEGHEEVPFFTNTFFREDVQGRRLLRVFWSWYNSGNKKNDGKVVWEINSNPTWYFGNTRALFKMYFTSTMRDPSETAEKSACLNFAREFLPVLEKALIQVSDPNAAPLAKADESTSDAKDATADAEATVEGESPAETATEEPAATPAEPSAAAETPDAK